MVTDLSQAKAAAYVAPVGCQQCQPQAFTISRRAIIEIVVDGPWQVTHGHRLEAAGVADQQIFAPIRFDAQAAQCASGGIADDDDLGAIVEGDGGAGRAVLESFRAHFRSRLTQQRIVILEYLVGDAAPETVGD